MARKPRPIDPAEGPIQAFAYDLRLVREAAGNPTYRALAGLAGFGATTLSDAAGGVRQPSLEVTLAYVGACGGDVDLWQQRWYELDRLLADERGAPARQEIQELQETPELQEISDPGAELPVDDVTPMVENVLAGPPRVLRWWSRWSGLGTALVLVAACSLFAVRQSAVVRTAYQTPAAAASAAAAAAASLNSAAPPCTPAGSPTPSARPARPGVFSGTTYGASTHVRSGASLNAPVVSQVPAGCTLQFTGYCLGDVIADSTAATADMRWFQLTGGGVVSSSVVHGNPPASMQPSRCPDDVPLPTSISLAITPHETDSAAVVLRATGPQVEIVGFAAYYSAGGAPAVAPQWHQIGFTATAATDFAIIWRLGALRKLPPDQSAIPVAAAACLGGDGPTDVVSAKVLQREAPASSQPATLAPADLVKAARAACHYPTPG